METRYLGRSGLKVSTTTMGTMTFGACNLSIWHQQATARRSFGAADLVLERTSGSA